MILDIICQGNPLPKYSHAGQSYAEAPPDGEYQILLRNDTSSRRLAVISVDGINIIDGETASYGGAGYLLEPWQTVTLKGWRRSESEAAAFQFKADVGSYAAQTGRGTSNTGIIGVALFDEKPKPPAPHAWRSGGVTISTLSRESGLGDPTPTKIHESMLRGASEGETSPYRSMSADDGYCTDFPPVAASAACAAADTPIGENFRSRKALFESMDLERRVVAKAPAPNLGTGYGSKVAQYTREGAFERVSSTPASVLTLRYGVREKLLEWGVPLPPKGPSAFPASEGPSCPAPPNWRG